MLISGPKGESMIITKILGGLGNQMFQYAAGRSLALANGSELKLDISGFSTYGLHNGYELDLFQIDADIATIEDLRMLAGAQSKIPQFIRQKLRLTKSSHIKEDGKAFDPSFFKIKEPVYLDGYWQSYEYLEPFKAQIKRDFTFKRALMGKNLQIAENITNSNAVSVHIRRGDYVTNQTFAKVHGFVGIDYFNRAIQHIDEAVSSPTFFVFSDDFEWANVNLRLEGKVVFVSHNTGKDSFEDMRLMSMCKHNIIANSSFSWWGAWLNDNSNKIVIAPRQWFADRSVVTNYENFLKNLLPNSWLLA